MGLSLLEIVLATEKRFAIQLRDESLAGVVVVRDLVDLVESDLEHGQTDETNTRWTRGEIEAAILGIVRTHHDPGCSTDQPTVALESEIRLLFPHG
jgi:hypothetical protein